MHLDSFVYLSQKISLMKLLFRLLPIILLVELFSSYSSFANKVDTNSASLISVFEANSCPQVRANDGESDFSLVDLFENNEQNENNEEDENDENDQLSDSNEGFYIVLKDALVSTGAEDYLYSNQVTHPHNTRLIVLYHTWKFHL